MHFSDSRLSPSTVFARVMAWGDFASADREPPTTVFAIFARVLAWGDFARADNPGVL